MRIYSDLNVHEAALDRVRWIFDEFEEVIVSVSGGKDSDVCYALAMQVAEEKGRLPLKVLFLDQEAEFGATVERIKQIMYAPNVEPLWYQIPLKLFNATSNAEHWLQCWDAAKKDLWVHPQDPISIKENRYGTDRFKELFGKIIKTDYPKKKVAVIGGVRCEESPARAMALTNVATYKWATWGKVLTKDWHYNLYPIYDWSFNDVWRFIYEKQISYNRIYDIQYQHGLPSKQMRVSNVHHETSMSVLFYLAEAEPTTWARLTCRLGGINTAAHLSGQYWIAELPPMFSGWREYRDYLAEKLLDPEHREKFEQCFRDMDEEFGLMTEAGKSAMFVVQCNSMLANDFEFTKVSDWKTRPQALAYKRWRKTGKILAVEKFGEWIPGFDQMGGGNVETIEIG